MQLVFYLLAINLLTFAIYWLDKRAAVRGDRRIPESTLLMCGFGGGTLAAIFAQQKLRHKTRKRAFQIKFWLLTMLQIILLITQPGPLGAIIQRLSA
jgi:uncharacterized membrane protein YsdA (DUF1294 family)